MLKARPERLLAVSLGGILNFVYAKDVSFDFDKTSEKAGVYNNTSDNPTGVTSGIFIHFRVSNEYFYHRAIICFDSTDSSNPQMFIRIFRSSWSDWKQVQLT